MTTTRTRAAAVGALASFGLVLTATSASADTPVDEPDTFTSAFTVMAEPGNVVDMENNPSGGVDGATGTFDFRINSDQEIICYDIEVTGISSEYQSPAKTATHIHEAPAGEAGPPRIAFPNPEGDGTRTSSGCLQGPFTTGVTNEETGADTGEGFTLAQIEADPSAFFADTHTSDAVPGAVRGQLVSVPVGGVDTGAGGTATDDGAMALGAGALGLTALAVGGVALAVRRRGSES